ncbi:cytochrome P450 [Trametes polyzona]|nr:cytochrome P450 [Trametes polyzona]
MLSIFASIVLSVIALLGAALWKAWPLLPRWTPTALKNLPGPPSPSWFYGNMEEIQAEDNSVPQERWVAQYGNNIKYKSFLNNDRLFTMDTRALNHILTHSADYQKPEAERRNLAKILGEGVIFTEGEQHRRQRRIMNPAFGPAQIRELTPVFVQKSIELRDLWDAQIAREGSPARIDVVSGITKMTLDVIGLAGFGFRFDALTPTGEPNELYDAFQELFLPDRDFTVLMVLKSFFPILDFIPDWESRRIERARAAMRRVGQQLIAEKKAQIQRELAGHKEKHGVTRGDLQGRDLLTLLLKANIATDIPESQRLSDEDVLAQVPTFLAAGHDTTSTATTWCLFALSQASEVQAKLRDELLTVETDTPTMDELNGLPYLDAVVRETLRLHAPVPVTLRVANKADVIPVSEPFVDRFGQVQDSIKISKGSSILIPILALNRSKKFWGEDAREFKPERWQSTPEAAASIPGVWSHLLTFIGGPRACIGYRFSIVEMKALVFVLVRAFEFALAVPPEEIQAKTSVVQRPILRSAPDQGNQLPMFVKRYVRNV